MFKVLFETEAEKTVESVNAALLRETGDPSWKFDSMESIDKAEKAGFLVFENNKLLVYADI